MNNLIIPENNSSVSKTLRFPENIAEEIEVLASAKGISFNKLVNIFVKFGLENLVAEDKKILDDYKKKNNKY